MNFCTLLKQRWNNPARVAVIGAGKFATMFLNQARLITGIKIVGIAELVPEKARNNCLDLGWPEDSMVPGPSAAWAAKRRRKPNGKPGKV